MPDEKTVRILYTNYRGETALRTVVPERIFFGSTEWHPEPQWLLEALDLEKGQSRSFAMKDVRAWLAN
jgi:predicted DNA-binding transcriptional regulator YafY